MATAEDSFTAVVSDVRNGVTRIRTRGCFGRPRVQRPGGRPARGERVPVCAADGYPLAAVRYTPAGRTRANLVVAGATAVPQRFYRRFAEYAASRGYATTTLDYRGIGDSAPPTLRGFRVDYGDWGRLDLAAAIDSAHRIDVPLYVVGHSYGGHAFGFLPNHDRVNAFYTFGTGAGWHGWMPAGERLRVLLLWHLVGPVLTGVSGYLSWSHLRMGEDLPRDFYRQWKHWCRFPNFFFGDPAMQAVAQAFAGVRTRMMAANAVDDRWSPPASRDAFIAGYCNAARQTLDIDPALVGLPAIGHMGYFRTGAVPLWDSALDWLDRPNGLTRCATSVSPLHGACGGPSSGWARFGRARP